MKVDIDLNAAVSDAVDRALPPSKLETIAQQMISTKIDCVTAREGAKRLGIGVKRFRSLGIPIVDISEKIFRYRVSDIEAAINKRTK